MMITYYYDVANNVTVINGSDVYLGKLDYKFVHDKYQVLVFEIIHKNTEILEIESNTDEHKSIS